jgi:hypothetical protein
MGLQYVSCLFKITVTYLLLNDWMTVYAVINLKRL